MTKRGEEKLGAIDDSDAGRVEAGAGSTLSYRPSPMVTDVLAICEGRSDIV